ncbi:MAG TPA: winged helix-turn-helix transcriptional regulator [Candidatus Thermoplasmatota archaeon]|nr:winged helix-turn-helix transcriptional regulator [Candidatus Thermoplasmatota archaeon]
MPGQALRDRTLTTRILILAHLESRPGATLSDVAQALGVTVQAVSAHARSMARAGWMASEDGAYRPTPKGLQALHEGVRSLRDAVAELAAPLDVIQVTSAVARAPIRAGDDVGLFMADGDLEARPARDAPSRGRALSDAKPGGEVIVADLKGMVRLEPGRLVLVSLPAPAEGGIAQVDRDRLRKRIAATLTPGKVGAHGTGASILARSWSRAGTLALDFEFAADRAAFNAAERGIDVLLLVTRDRLPEVMQAFERLNAQTLRRVPIELLEAPERHA